MAHPAGTSINRLVVLISAIVLVDTMFYAVVAPMLPQLADELSLSKVGAGVLTASYPAGTLFGSLPGGVLASRVGPKPTVLVGLSLLAASSLAFGLLHNIVALDCVRFVQGIGGACSWAGGLAWLVAEAPDDRRGEMIGTALGAAIGGALLGPVVGGLAEVTSRGLVFGTVVVFAGGLAIAAIATPSEHDPVAERVSDVKRALRHAPIAGGMWLVALPAVAFGVIGVLGPLRLDRFGATGVAIGATFLVAAAVEATMSPLVGRVSDRRGRLVPIRFGLAGGAVVLTVFTVPTTAILLAATIAVTAAVLGSFWAPSMAMLSESAEGLGLSQGMAFALVNLAWAVGQVTGSGAGGALAKATTDAVPLVIVAVLCLLTLSATLRGGRIGAAARSRTAMSQAARREALDLLATDLRERLLTEVHDGGGAPSSAPERIRSLVEREAAVLTRDDRDELVRLVSEKSFGLGPLEPLLSDPTVDEIMVNGPGTVWVERAGVVEASDVHFSDAAELSAAIERILAPLGRRVDAAEPLCDARLPDGSRVNVVIAPLALDGPVLTIRRFRRAGFTAADLVSAGTWSEPLCEFMRSAVQARLNILVCGGTGSGKTTTLNALSSFIGAEERVVTIEDTAELRLQQHHVVRLEARPPSVEGRGEVTIRRLVRNAMRMRPDRIIVGEVRGPEALDMLGAMCSGHDGSLCTVHASSPQEALRRIETLALMAGVGLPHAAVGSQVAAAIDLVVHQARVSGGGRRILAVSEVVRVASGPATREVFVLRSGRPVWRAPLSQDLAARLGTAAAAEAGW